MCTDGLNNLIVCFSKIIKTKHTTLRQPPPPSIKKKKIKKIICALAWMASKKPLSKKTHKANTKMDKNNKLMKKTQIVHVTHITPQPQFLMSPLYNKINRNLGKSVLR